MTELPLDPEERAKVLKPYRMMARTMVGAIDHGLKTAELSGIDPDERECGVEAFSGVLAAYNANASPWFAVGLFMFGLASTRGPEYLIKRREKQKREGKLKEREVTGTATVTAITPKG